VGCQTVATRRPVQTPAAPFANCVPTQNHLIELVSRDARRRLLAKCEPIDLVLGQVVCEPGTSTRHVYFPIGGFISLIASVPGSPGIEVGMVGSEGMLGSQLALGVAATPLHAVVQGAGSALRIGGVAFRTELARSPTLQRALERYIAVVMVQLATSAVCLRFHEIEPRLARWLLMSNDRAHADTFRMTHEFLAHMLGVRRVGITSAAGALQRRGLIDYRRGVLAVRDRPGLEAASCPCYAADRGVYARQLG
jgi:CRP-like cAMP-binding protein